MEKVLVLGGGFDQIDLILKLKKRGFFVILIDYNENPVAKEYADAHIQKSTLDMEMIVEIAKVNEISNILTACTDQSLVSMAYASEKLKLPCFLSYEQALNVTNKVRMKEIFKKYDIPSAPFKIITNDNQNLSFTDFPLIIKPSDCNSSKGVRKIVSEEEYYKYINETLCLSRSKQAIIEKFLEGIELSIDAYVFNDKVEIISVGELKKKFVTESTQLIYQNIIPAPLTEDHITQIKDIATKISKGFNITNSPLLIQAILRNNNIYVLEFSSRIGGGAKHRSIKFLTGFDILEANIDSLLLNNPNLPENFSKTSGYLSRIHLYLRPGRLKEIKGVDDLFEKRIINEYTQNKPLGTFFSFPKASTDRLGSFLLTAKTQRELDSKISEALKTLKMLNDKGESMLFNEIYSQFL